MQSAANNRITILWPVLPAGRALSGGRRPGTLPTGFRWTGTILMSGKEFEEREARAQKKDVAEAEDEVRRRRADEGLEHLEYASDETGQHEGDPFTRLIAGYQDLSRRRPTDAEAHFHYGRQFLQVSLHDWAISAFERALGLMPRWADAQYYYASALFAAGRLDEAEKEYEKARELDPTMMEARVEHELLKLRAERAQNNRN